MELNESDFEMLENIAIILKVDGHGGLYSQLKMIMRKIKRDD